MHRAYLGIPPSYMRQEGNVNKHRSWFNCTNANTTDGGKSVQRTCPLQIRLRDSEVYLTATRLRKSISSHRFQQPPDPSCKLAWSFLKFLHESRPPFLMPMLPWLNIADTKPPTARDTGMLSRSEPMSCPCRATQIHSKCPQNRALGISSARPRLTRLRCSSNGSFSSESSPAQELRWAAL